MLRKAFGVQPMGATSLRLDFGGVIHYDSEVIGEYLFAMITPQPDV